MICSGPEHSLPMRCQLILAQHRVTKALQLVAEQTARIEHLRAAGAITLDAEQALRLLERNLEICEQERDSLQR
jgi:hypothetical protein